MKVSARGRAADFFSHFLKDITDIALDVLFFFNNAT